MQHISIGPVLTTSGSNVPEWEKAEAAKSPTPPMGAGPMLIEFKDLAYGTKHIGMDARARTH